MTRSVYVGCQCATTPLHCCGGANALQSKPTSWSRQQTAGRMNTPIIGGAHARPQLAVSLWPAINGERKTQQYHRAMKMHVSPVKFRGPVAPQAAPRAPQATTPGKHADWGDLLRFGVVLGRFKSIFKSGRARFSYFQKSDDERSKMVKPDMSCFRIDHIGEACCGRF